MTQVIKPGNIIAVSKNLRQEDELFGHTIIVGNDKGSFGWIQTARLNWPLKKFNDKRELIPDPEGESLAYQVAHALEREASLVKARSYSLTNDNGSWLAQVVLTNDGMFSCVSDWGNFSFAWRSAGTDFRSFIIGLNVDYFANKMAMGLSYIIRGKSYDRACKKFSEMILPKLQHQLKEEINNNTPW